MKKLILILILVTGTCLNARSQCLFAIPPNAVVTDTNLLINGGFDPVWVCKGDTLFTGGGFHNIYLEAGSVLSVSGGIDTIFVKNTATLLMSGGIHYVYYENNNDLNLNGGIPTLDSCSFIIFDYANAPLNGCFPAPVAGLSASDSAFCENACIGFTDLSYNNPVSWQWYFPGATPDTSTLQHPVNICYSANGSYDVVLVVCNGSGCDSIYLTAFIHEFPNPPVPVITQSGDTLFVSASYNYQWVDTMNPAVVLSNDSIFVPAQAGFYQVRSCDTTGCCSFSNVIHIIGTGIMHPPGDSRDTDVRIYPNPAQGIFNIQLNDVNSGKRTITVFNCQSEIIYHANEEPDTLNSRIRLDLSAQPPGIYFVQITTKTYSRCLKAVIRNEF